MPDITPAPWGDLPSDTRWEVHSALEAATAAITAALYGTPRDSAQADGEPPAAQRDHRLARIAAREILAERLRGETQSDAYAAGAVDGAPATYADLGRAVGIGREAARSRWPGAVPDAKPGRPRRAYPFDQDFVDPGEITAAGGRIEVATEELPAGDPGYDPEAGTTDHVVARGYDRDGLLVAIGAGSIKEVALGNMTRRTYSPPPDTYDASGERPPF